MQNIADILHADACIIDEHGDHLVIAVRIPKALITANHALLAALSERSAPAPMRARAAIARQGTTIMRHWSARIAVAAACAASVLLWPPLVNWTEASADAPVKVYGARLLAENLHQHAELQLMVRAIRKRLCPQSEEISITRAGDGANVVSDLKLGSAEPVTTYPIARVLSYRLPSNLPPAGYKYRRVAYAECDGKTFATVLADDLPFTVIE